MLAPCLNLILIIGSLLVMKMIITTEECVGKPLCLRTLAGRLRARVQAEGESQGDGKGGWRR